MPLLFPAAFPLENAPNTAEIFRFARQNWKQLQKFRGRQFDFATTVPASNVQRQTFIDVTVGGTDTGFDLLQPGMWLSVTPPASIPTGLQVDYAFCPAAGQLTLQLRNGAIGDLSVSGTWAYVGFVLP